MQVGSLYLALSQIFPGIDPTIVDLGMDQICIKAESVVPYVAVVLEMLPAILMTFLYLKNSVA